MADEILLGHPVAFQWVFASQRYGCWHFQFDLYDRTRFKAHVLNGNMVEMQREH